MNNATKRPLSIWITQILLIIFTIFLLSFLVLPILSLSNNAGKGSINVAGLAVYFLIQFGLISLFLISFWGLVKRKTYGRWLGLTSLILILSFVVFSQIIRPKGPIEYYEYENNTQLMAAYFTQGIMLILFLALILNVAFSKRVTAFFQPQIESE